MSKLETWFSQMPVVAILRGLTAERAIETVEAIFEQGIGIAEVPLNSPAPLDTITRLAQHFGDEFVVGAGTVLTKEQVQEVAAAGGKIAVSPNTNTDVIKTALANDITPMPGWSSATEAFSAYEAGARFLKLFPAASYGVTHLQSLNAVLPTDCRVLAVGGVSATDVTPWFKAGAIGLGVGSELFKPSYSLHEVRERAKSIVAAVQSARDGE